MTKIVMILAAATLAFGQTSQSKQNIPGPNQNMVSNGSQGSNSSSANSGTVPPTLEDQIADAEKEVREAKAILDKAETEYSRQLKSRSVGEPPPFSPDMERVRWTEATRLLLTLQTQQLRQKHERYWSNHAAKMKELDEKRKEADARFCASSALALAEPGTTGDQRSALLEIRRMLCDKK